MLSHLLKFSLSQRFLLVVLALTLAGWGLFSYRRLPIDAFPDISNTQVQMIVKAPGMTPLEVEQRITQPVEIEVRGIQNQTNLRSLTKYALSIVTIDFADGTDIYWARQQVAERINQVLADFPAGVEGGLAPITMPLSDVFMFLVEGEGYSKMELRSILDWIVRPRLLSVEGVADVNSLGGEVRSYHVRPWPEKLAALDLTIDDVTGALERNNRNAGGDRFVDADEVLLVTTDGQLHGIQDIRGIPIATRDGVPIHVQDVADVSLGAMTRYGGVTAHGRGEAVEGLVLNRRGANSRQTVDGVKRVLEEVKESLPPGVTIETFYDRSDLITKAVGTVETALLQAVVLVLLVLLLFLANLRSAVTVGLVLPLTVLGTFVIMSYAGITANLMSLGGIAIAVGILVDSAVVMVDNIHGRIYGAAKQERRRVVREAAGEVATPIFAGVVIIVVSFLPILSLTGIEGKLFRPLAATISLALGTSLLLSLTVIPVLGSLWMNGGKTEGNFFLRLLYRLYAPPLRFALRRGGVVFGISVALFVVAVWLGSRIGREFLPFLDEGTLVLQTEKLPSIALDRSMEIDDEMARDLMELPEITGVVSRVGSDELRLDPMGLNESDIFLVTLPREEWPEPDVEALQRRIRDKLSRHPGILLGFTQPIDMRVSEMISGVASDVAIKLMGDDLDILEDRAGRIASVVSRTPGAVDVSSTPLRGQQYLRLVMKHQEMSRLGVDVEDVNELITTAVGGETATEVIEGTRRIPVLVRFPEEYRDSASALAKLRLTTPSGAVVELGNLVRIVEEDGPVQIEREDGKRQVVISANVEDRDVVGFVEEVRRRVAAEIPLPPGYFVQYDGQFANQARAMLRLLLVVPVSLFIIFMILLSTFGSTRQALVILGNIPLAFLGGVFLLWISGLYLSIPASVGFIALLGLAVMNGVVLINTFNHLRDEGLELRAAVEEGARRRQRPVLMTAILTILGLIPLLLATGPGSEVQKPLAIVVIGGTFSSTFLTLILLPTVYVWMERRARRQAR